MAAIHEPKYPPWSGPTVLPTGQTDQAAFPLSDDGASFPPVCLRSHWDPEMIIRRSLPSARVSLPLDPRPLTKVCMEYVTSAPFEMAPKTPESLVFPSGGTVYPPTRYRNAVDKESMLRRLDRPLGTCEAEQFEPHHNLYTPNATVPDRGKPNSRFIQELAFPMALMRSGTYDCRRENDEKAMANNEKMFNNATKQNRLALRP
jgi:hypothetical protein